MRGVRCGEMEVMGRNHERAACGVKSTGWGKLNCWVEDKPDMFSQIAEKREK